MPFRSLSLLVSARLHVISVSNRGALRTAHAAAQAKKEGDVGYVPHSDVVDGNIPEYRAIHRLQSDSFAIFNHAAGDGNVAEAAVTFRTELDPSIARNLVKDTG